MKYRWLLWLVAVTLVAIALPLVGIAFPRLAALRDFVYTWIFVYMTWILVVFYHALKLVTGGPPKT